MWLDQHSGWSEGWIETGQERAGLATLFANFKRSEVNGIWVFSVLFLVSVVVLFCVFRQCVVEPHRISSESRNKREVDVQPRT